MKAAALAALLCAVAAVPAMARGPAAAPVPGTVTKVVDGDSLWIQPATGAAVEVRLRDIDAPEICQDHGPEAKRALEQMVLGKPVTYAVQARDAHGRALSSVWVDGQSLSRLLVAEGHAWSQRSRWDRGPLVREERMAQALKRGLHTLANPVHPKDFRKAHGPCRPA